MPEHVLALIFSIRRGILSYREDVLNGMWEKSNQFCFFNQTIFDLCGSKMGIIGGGTIGKATAKLAKALGINVLFSGRKNEKIFKPNYLNFNELIESCDILSVHCPLTPDTKDLISFKEFSMMKQKPIIINASRGGIINENAIVEAINEEKISGVGLDVLTAEPPNKSNPIFKIIDRPNVIVTPHIAWSSVDAMEIIWKKLILNIDNFLSGEPSNLIE